MQKIEDNPMSGILGYRKPVAELQFLLSLTIGGTVSQVLASHSIVLGSILVFLPAFLCSCQHAVPTVTTACSRYNVATGLLPARQ